MTAAPTAATARDEALVGLGRAFKGTIGAVRRLRGRETHRPGAVSYAQHHLLFGLAGHDELSTGELAVAADLSPATATQMLDHLVELGFVERRRSESDRRIVSCSLTEQGRELVDAHRTQMEARYADALAEFSDRELATAAAVLDRLRAMFESFE